MREFRPGTRSPHRHRLAAMAVDHAKGRYDVIVVGAGYGGATCAALLAGRGYRVAVIDKNPAPGGKAMTLHRDGNSYEMWPIVGGPATGSRIEELLELIEAPVPEVILTPERAAEFRYIRPDGSMTMTPVGSLPGSVMGLPADPSVGEPELAAAAAMAVAALTMAENDLALLDDVDILTWMSTYDVGDVLRAHQLAILNLLFVAPVDRIPASEALRTLKDFGLKGAGRYHAGGYAVPAELAVEYVTSRGGTYLPRTAVDRIVIENGTAIGVMASGVLVEAPVVVSNAGIQPTVLSLAGPDQFPPAYVDRVMSLEPSWAFVGLRYFLDAPVMEVPMILQFSGQSWWDTDRYVAARAGHWPDHPLLFAATPALYDPTLVADPSRQVVLAGTMASPDPKSPMSAAAIERTDAEMLATWPELEGHVTRRESFTAANTSAASRASVVPGQGGECIGLAQVIGQCGASKPDPVTPVRGLFLTGCDAGGYGCGTHQAVESGFVVADLVAAALG